MNIWRTLFARFCSISGGGLTKILGDHSHLWYIYESFFNIGAKWGCISKTYISLLNLLFSLKVSIWKYRNKVDLCFPMFFYTYMANFWQKVKKQPENSRKMADQMFNHSMHCTTFFCMILFLLLREIFSAEQFHKMYKEMLHLSFIINYKWKLFN